MTPSSSAAAAVVDLVFVEKSGTGFILTEVLFDRILGSSRGLARSVPGFEPATAWH